MSSHHLFSPASLLGSASALGAFRATPRDPTSRVVSLEETPPQRAHHPSQKTPSKYTAKPSIINHNETQNSYERLNE
jgi:hypothetical protein